MAPLESQIHLEIGSRIENVELVQIAVEASLEQLDLDDDLSDSIGTAVREAVANAIQHGNGADPDKRVEVDLGLDGEVLVIRVRDQGSGFDPGDLPDPLARENLLRPDGRGIFFMKKLMDRIDYSFEPEGGTVVTLRKRVLDTGGGESKKEEDDR